MSHEKPRHRAGFFVCGRVVGEVDRVLKEAKA